MRLARVIGKLVLDRKLPELKAGSLLVVEAFDGDALEGHATQARRSKPMPESLVVFDELGAGAGDVIAVSEGREAAMPFWPQRVPIDAYCAAIIDVLHLEPQTHKTLATSP